MRNEKEKLDDKSHRNNVSVFDNSRIYFKRKGLFISRNCFYGDEPTIAPKRQA